MEGNSEEIINTYESSPDKQQLTHKLSISLAGEVPSRKHLKDDLLKRHYQNLHHVKECLEGGALGRQLVIPAAYSPSIVPLDKLQKVPSRDFGINQLILFRLLLQT
jgi:hypothetical protein